MLIRANWTLQENYEVIFLRQELNPPSHLAFKGVFQNPRELLIEVPDEAGWINNNRVRSHLKSETKEITIINIPRRSHRYEGGLIVQGRILMEFLRNEKNYTWQIIHFFLIEDNQKRTKGCPFG